MIIVRRMEEKDILRAEELEKDNFSEPWSQKAFRETIHLDYAYYFVAEEGESVIGICGLRNIAGEGEITNVVWTKTTGSKELPKCFSKKRWMRAGCMASRRSPWSQSGKRACYSLYKKLGLKVKAFEKIL